MIAAVAPATIVEVARLYFLLMHPNHTSESIDESV